MLRMSCVESQVKIFAPRIKIMTVAKKKVLFGLLLLLSFCMSRFGAALPRIDVVKYGPTVAPGFIRKEGKAAGVCPASQPVPLGNYEYCCSKIKGSSESEECLGLDLTPDSPPICCDGDLIPCSTESKCRAGNRPGMWSSWANWEGCYAACETTDGYKERRRSCTNPLPYPPDDKDMACYEDSSDSTSCSDFEKTACAECAELETDYGGNDVDKETEVPDSAACQNLCKESPNCFYFTYVTPAQICYLKSPKSVQQSDKLSGFDVHCLQTECYAVNKGIKGADIDVLNDVANELDCAAHCGANKLCKAFVWSNPSYSGDGKPNQCYLKGGTDLYLEPAENLHSGFMDCACFQDGIDYNKPSQDVPDRNWAGISHPLICLIKCIQEPLCDYFVMSKTDGHCWLKSWRLVARSHRENHISGTRGCKLN